MISEPTVYIVDDDDSACRSLKALVMTLGLQVETFSSAKQFLDQFDPSRHGCVVTDLRMEGMSGIELQERLAASGSAIPVIVITAFAETRSTVKAMKSGAVTVLEKPCGDKDLQEAIRAALAEDAKARLAAQAQSELRERLRSLTPEESIILGLMVEGAANKVIARRLGVSVRTIENRRQRIFEKTGAKSLAELVRLVVEARGGSTN